MDRMRHGELKVSLWLPRVLWKRAKIQAADEGRALRLLILDAIDAYLKRKEETTR
jgi:hypothetical protein